MTHIIQVLLPLVCVVLAVAQQHMPFLNHNPGQSHLAQPITDGPRDSGYDTWSQNFGNPEEHSSNSDPFYHGDPYYDGNGWDQMPRINNVFNIPNPGYDAHIHQLPLENNPQERPKQDHKDILNDEKPEEKPTEIPPIDKKPTEQDKVPKLNEDNIPGVKNKTYDPDVETNLLPPKTNKIKGDEKKDKDNLEEDLDKNNDFLLVSQGIDGNNVYLLHENSRNQNTVIVPNDLQPGNNIVYVPYYSGQTNNPVYQVINRQPGSLPTNIQMTQDMVGVSNGYNNALPNTGQATLNVITGKQNPGYVTIYSNGQLIQVPGVFVKLAPNNVPIQNGNQVQGTNYIIANTVPNNSQPVPAIKNPGTSVIYGSNPNQASNNPIYGKAPNCVNAMANGCGSSNFQGVNNGISRNGLPSNTVLYQANPNMVVQPAVLANTVPNGYVQPNMVTDQGQGQITLAIPNQVPVFSNQNGPYQHAIKLPVNSGSNGYNQPIVLNLGQGQNAPNQESLMNNHNMVTQTAVLLPVGNRNNGYIKPVATNQGQRPTILYQGAIQMPSNTNNKGYYQPTVSSQRPELNAPNQGVKYEQYTPTQPAVQMPVNNGINGYAPSAPNLEVTVNNKETPLQPDGYYVNPPVVNPVTVKNLGDQSNNQNVQPQPAVTVNSGSNGYLQPQEPNQGDQGTNAIISTPGNGKVINQESNNAQPVTTSSLDLDSNNLSTLGVQPANSVSELKDKSSDKKEKKDKKPKEEEKPKVSELFTNKVEDAR